MLQFNRPEDDHVSRWCIVTTLSGHIAVVALEDIGALSLGISIGSLTLVSLSEAENLEKYGLAKSICPRAVE